MDFESRLKRAQSLVKSEPDEAMFICNHVMDEDVDGKWGQMALFMTGYIMMEAERYGLAYHIYERCSQLNPSQSEIYSNMGMCLEEYDPYKAIRMFQKARQLNPKNANAYANEALLHLQTGDPKKCVELSDKALSINPELKSAVHNKGLAQLMLRDWANGWSNYYDTLGVKFRKRRDYGVPEWEGQKDCTVVVYGEQGVGDEIMFASCLGEMSKDVNIILDCDKRLEDLFRRSFGCPVYGTRFSKETPLVDECKFDYQCAIGQLPYFYRNTADSFRGDPYLTPDPDRSVQWAALFDSFPGKKIGVAWSGGSKNTGEKRRTLNVDDLSPLFNGRDTFVCLEYRDAPKDVLDKYNLKSYPRDTGKGQGIDYLASIIAELDYVVTACTTVVYVAGALGVPCYVLTPDKPSYRYHLNGEFPWYHSVHLIRQKTGEPWVETVKRAKETINAESLHRLRSKRDGGVSRLRA